MSQQDVETLRRGYEAFGAGDLRSTLGFIHSDIEVEVLTDRLDRRSDQYRGHEGFLSNLGELTEVFDDFKMEPEEIRDGGERIMVETRVTGRGKVSGAGFEARIFHVWTIRDGLAARLEIYSDRERALTALEERRATAS